MTSWLMTSHGLQWVFLGDMGKNRTFVLTRQDWLAREHFSWFTMFMGSEVWEGVGAEGPLDHHSWVLVFLPSHHWPSLTSAPRSPLFLGWHGSCAWIHLALRKNVYCSLCHSMMEFLCPPVCPLPLGQRALPIHTPCWYPRYQPTLKDGISRTLQRWDETFMNSLIGKTADLFIHNLFSTAQV